MKDCEICSVLYTAHENGGWVVGCVVYSIPNADYISHGSMPDAAATTRDIFLSGRIRCVTGDLHVDLFTTD
jgi:hypothetical protein